MCDVYQREKAAYHTQRAALEVGHLTEDLLPPETLEDILQQAIAQGYKVMTQLEWYYQHLEVKPIFSEQDNLLYQVTIPLIHDEQYLQYSIQTFPVPYKNSEMSAKLEISGHVGFNTQTGDLFLPKFCIGMHPTVCRSGPVYQSGRLNCIRGILNGVKSQTEYCTVQVTKGRNETEVQEVDVNTYVITTWGKSLIERCASQNEKAYELKPDTYIVTVKYTCSVMGQSWAIHGIKEENINKHIKLKQSDVPVTINITETLQIQKLPRLFHNVTSGVKMSAVDNVPLSLKLTDPYPDNWVNETGKCHLSWVISKLFYCLLLQY